MADRGQNPAREPGLFQGLRQVVRHMVPFGGEEGQADGLGAKSGQAGKLRNLIDEANRDAPDPGFIPDPSGDMTGNVGGHR